MNLEKSPFSGPEAADMFTRYLHTISAESDRGAVLIAAALLDSALEDVLKKKLVVTPEKEDALFDGAYAPLRSFSAKIELAFRLGLIMRKTRQMLHLVRKLRNEFAHSPDGVTTHDDSVRARLRAMFEMMPEIYSALRGTIEEIINSETNLAPSDFLETARGRRELLNVFFAANAMALRRLEMQVEPTPELTSH